MRQILTSPLRGHAAACAGLTLGVLVGCAAVPAAAPAMPDGNTAVIGHPASPAQAQQRFSRWIEGFAATARGAGITEETLHAAFDDVRFLARVV